jgi:hypothetical protein
VLDVPEETMPVTLSSSETQRARRLAMLSTCFLLVSHFIKVWEHVLISGLINPKVNAFIGSGVVVHIPSLFNELDTLERKGNFILRTAEDKVADKQVSRSPTGCSSLIELISFLDSTRLSMVSRKLNWEDHPSELPKRVSDQLTLPKLPGLVFESTICTILLSLKSSENL